MNRRQTLCWKAIYYLVVQGCQPWRFPAAGKDLWQISSKSRTFQRLFHHLPFLPFTRSVFSPHAWHIYKITGLSPQPQCNCTAGMHAVSPALPESTDFTEYVPSDYSMSVRYFYSGPCKNIHGLQPLARQLTGPLIIPGLPLQESRLICPIMLKYLHFEKDKIIFSTHWTVLSYARFGLFQAELLWITNEKTWGFFVALAFTQGPFTDIILGRITPLLKRAHILNKHNRRVQAPTATEALQVKASRRHSGFLSFCLWTTKQ